MKFVFIPLIAYLIVFGGQSALAETPVSLVLYKADPAAKNGFAEEYRWRMNKTDEWRRFEYLMAKMKPGRKENISPFLKKPEEMLVVSVKDENGLTGKDYYLSKDGIMVTSISARNSYFYDKTGFFDLLKDQLKQRSGFERFPGEKISTSSRGILARYRINETLPNPAWLVDKQREINIYDSLLRNLQVPDKGYINSFIKGGVFEDKGNFILILNYPKAPARFATVGRNGIRLSNISSSDSFFMDEKKYYQFFYDLTQESRKTSTEVQQKEKTILEQGQF